MAEYDLICTGHGQTLTEEVKMSNRLRFYYFGSRWNAYQWHYFALPRNWLSINKTIDVVISGIRHQRVAISIIGFVFMIDCQGLAEKPE